MDCARVIIHGPIYGIRLRFIEHLIPGSLVAQKTFVVLHTKLIKPRVSCGLSDSKGVQADAAQGNLELCNLDIWRSTRPLCGGLYFCVADVKQNIFDVFGTCWFELFKSRLE